MIFDLMDDLFAEELGVSTKVFIDKIERTSERRMELILRTLMDSEDPKKIEQAKRIFNLIK